MTRVLANTNESLQVVLDGAVTTNELQCTAHYADDNGTSFVEGMTSINTNGATPITLVAAPAASTRRLISDWTIYNRDTVVQNVTVRIDIGGTPYIVYKIAVPSYSTLNMDGTVSGEQAWFDQYPPSATDPAGTPAEGEHYYNTALDTMMQYDGTRSKWLSMESIVFLFGRSGNTPAGSYYRGSDGLLLSATSGYPVLYNATLVGFGYTRTDTDAATFVVAEDGVSRATIASSAVSGVDNTLNANVTAGGVIAVLNQAGGNITSNVQGYVRLKWRA